MRTTQNCKPGRLAAHDGLGDRVWLVVDDVHELARRSRTSGSKKLQARVVAYRFVCCDLRSTHYSSGHMPWSGRNTFGQGVTHVRIGRGPACQIIPSLIAPHYAAPSACRPRSYHVTTWPRHWPTDSAKSPPAFYPHAAGAPTPRRRREISNLGVKRDEHRNRPQPTRDPADTVTVARTGAPSRSTHQPRHDQANLKSLVLTLASIR